MGGWRNGKPGRWSRSFRWRGGRAVLLGIGVIGAMVSGEAAVLAQVPKPVEGNAQPKTCLPADWDEGVVPFVDQGEAPETERLAQRVDLWLDASGSMKGFVGAGGGSPEFPLPNVLEKLHNYFVVSGAQVSFNFFAKGMRSDLPAAQFMQARYPDFYNDPSVTENGFNQESHLKDPITRALEDRSDKVSVILTDLSPFETGTPIMGEVGEYAAPIRQVLQRNWTVGVVGIPSRFQGRLPNPAAAAVAAPPPVSKAAGNKKTPPPRPASYIEIDAWLPFFLLVIGPAPEVRSTLSALRQEVLPTSALDAPGGQKSLPQIAVFGQSVKVVPARDADAGTVRWSEPALGSGIETGRLIISWLADYPSFTVDVRGRLRNPTSFVVAPRIAVLGTSEIKPEVEVGGWRVRTWALEKAVDVAQCRGATWRLLPAPLVVESVEGLPSALLGSAQAASAPAAAPPPPADATATADEASAPPRASGSAPAPEGINVYPLSLTSADRALFDKVLLTRVTASLRTLQPRNQGADWLRAWADAGATRRGPNGDPLDPTQNLDLSFLERLAGLLLTAERFKVGDAARGGQTVVDFAFTTQLNR